jgi:hypothetical protein
VTLARGSVPGLKKNLGNVDNGYCVYPTHNCTKLHAKHIGYVHAEEPVEMTAARREGESIQLGIVPLLQPLRQVQVEISDLTGSGKATIPASAWTRFRVGDVAAPAGVNEFYGMPAGTRWPDPLLPYEPFDCPGDEMRAVLLTLNVPADAVPGDYTGTITVAPAEKKPTTVPVKVHVFNFTLPERRTLLWDSWYDMDTVGRYYGYGPETDLEHFTRNMEMLARYRAVPGLYGWVVLAKNVAVWREADGRFTFDFSKYDRWIEITQRYGNLWNPNGSCNSGWLAIFSSPGLGNIVHDRQTGKPLTLKELPEKSAVDPNFTLIYEKFMQAYVTHLKEKGWLATAWHEAWDEPVRERVEPCKQHHAYLMKIVPELHQFAWAHEVTQAWAPNLGAWYEEFPGIEAARKEGKTCFFYTCGADYPNPDPARTRPDISIWDPNIQRRAYPWVFDKIGADGMLIFMMNGWGDANEKNGKNPATRWPRSDWTVEDRNTFWLVYPAPDGSLWPSLRLDALRDGFEDYEYLTAARALVKAHPENKEAAARLAAITSPVTTREFYELDPSAYDQRKQELGRIIEAFGTK